jgi:hypothetical protein
VTAEGGDRWRPLAAPDEAYRLCANGVYGTCNWLVPADGPEAFCRACRLNRTIPDLDAPGNLLLWQRLEAAKHRLVYGLLRLGLPLVSKFEDAEKGLAFDFLAGSGAMFQEDPQVVTGHARGLITIDIAEADDAERERHRRDMAEPYRTVLGHFRHEIGHHYWERLVRDGLRLVRDGLWHTAFRELFGDERRNYGSALDAHYANGPQPGWQEHYVSSYAGAHPWEDFAETWAPIHPPQGRSQSRARDGDRSLPPGRLRCADRGMAAAHLRGQQPQPQHGPAGPLPLRPGADGHGEATLFVHGLIQGSSS